LLDFGGKLGSFGLKEVEFAAFLGFSSPKRLTLDRNFWE
jgi:hypothetical protein